ncbi:MAG: alpha/beta hydrolase [Acetobacteraceae bacterium]|nr:alpha/beta fold hydrolase [Pseudomonadota bacterium]
MFGQAPVPGCILSWSLLDLTPPWIESPETIVMHHGIGANRHIFDGWLPALIGRYRILRFDMRGHGASSRPEDQPLDLDRLTDDLFAVMDAAGVGQAHLLGESIGGTVVLNAALRAPERVRRLAVSNGAHVGGSIQSVAGWERMIRGEGMAAWSDFMMQGRFHGGAIPEAQRDWFAAQQATACPDTVLRLLAALVGADLSPRLPGLRPKLLLLHPDNSPFIPVAVMAALRDLVPGARLHVIGQARHGLPFSHPETCARLLAAFLNEP